MKKSLIFLLLFALIGCRGEQSGQGDGQDSAEVDSVLVDTTIYGVSYEFGMSTFSLITDAGDTLELERGEGHIHGNLDKEGDRFALTVRGMGTDTASVATAINLTNVESFVTAYNVCNGQLIFDGDTVDILDLTTDSLIAQGKKTYRYGK